MKTRKWYSAAKAPDRETGLIFMTDMGYVFEGVYKDDKWYRLVEKDHKMYSEPYDHPECIIKWMKI